MRGEAVSRQPKNITECKRTEDSVWIFEARYRRLFESAKDGILVLNAHTGKIIDSNFSIGELLGYSQAELLDQELWQIGLFEGIEASQAAIRELQENHYLRRDDLLLKTKTGQWIPVEVVSNIYREGWQAMIQCNIREISERKQAEESEDALKERLTTTELTDLERLHVLSTQLIQQDSLAAVLHEVLVASAALLHVDKGSVQIYDAQSHTLKLISAIGLEQDFADQFSFVDVYGSLPCAAALRRGERVIVEDLSTHLDFIDFARVAASYGIYAAQSTPLFSSDGKLSGMITIFFDRPYRPSERELQLLDLYAQQAVRRIERTESEEALRQSEARLAMELVGTRQLQEISTQLIQSNSMDSLYRQLLDAATTIMRSNAASIQVFYPDRGRLRLLAWKGFHPESAAFWEWVDADSSSRCGAVFSADQRVIVPDIETCDFMVGTPDFDAFCQSGLRAMQSTPLLSRTGRMLGMISTYWHEPHQPAERDLRLLDVLARQAADLIERTQVEQRLHTNEEQLRQALSAGKFGHWRLNLAGLDLTSSVQCKANFGRGADEPFTYEMFQASIYPDDRVMVEAAVNRAIGECGDYEADYRCLWPDGSTHWIKARGRVLCDGSDQVARIIGTTLDITERKQAEALLAGQKRVLEMLATGVPLAEVLATLIRVIEAQSEGLLGSILIRQPDSNRFSMGVAPSLPESYTQALRQAPISPPYLSPCGRASHLGETITIADIATDQRWSKEWRDLALGLSLRTCYSSSIFASDSKVLGSFGMYYRDRRDPPRLPNSQLLETATYLAGIAIERRQAEEALREADRRKDEFLAMLAHELRNPLAPIFNAAQLLQIAEGDGEVIRTASEMIERQIGLVVRLVDDLLDVSRVTRGKIELRRESIELASAIDQAVESTRLLVQSLGHELTVTLPPQPVYLRGDLMRLAQVIGNLLSNACKFTPKGGHIWLTVERQEKQAVIRVRDTGIGIAANRLSYIFEVFTQVDTSLSRTQKGLGIGLALAKSLVEMHGGAVEVHSDGQGQGSEFLVRLPLGEGAPKPLPPGRSELPSVTGCRILVVDDNRDAAMGLATWLKLSGNETQIAYDGLAAVETSAAFKPDVILLDIGLPKLNGYEVARRIRGQPGGERIILVAITGWGREEDRQKSKETGFNSHMVKPVDHAVLARLLAKSLEFHRD